MSRILALQLLSPDAKPSATCISFNFSSFGLDTI